MNKLFKILLIASFTLSTHFAHAGFIVSDVSAEYGGGNSVSGGSCCFNFIDGVQDLSLDGSAVAAIVSGTLQYTGDNNSGQSDIMTVIYDAENYITEQGEFKAGVSLSVDNPFYNVNNPPYVLDDNFDENSVDPNGLPESIYTSTYTFYRNDLTVQSESEVSLLEINFSIDGWVKENGAQANTFVDAVIDGDWETVVDVDPAGSTNDLYTEENISFFIDVINGEAILELEWYLDVRIDLDTLLANVSGSVDFLNTLKFGEFTAFDANGKIINDAKVVGSAGRVFSKKTVNNVPSPGSLSILGLGIASLCFTRRKVKF